MARKLIDGCEAREAKEADRKECAKIAEELRMFAELPWRTDEEDERLPDLLREAAKLIEHDGAGKAVRS